MAPSYGLGGVTLVLIVLQVSEWCGRYAAYSRIAVSVALCAMIAVTAPLNLRGARRLYAEFAKSTPQHLQLNALVRSTYKDYAKIFYTEELGASSVEHALDFGNRYALCRHALALYHLYPKTYFMYRVAGATAFRDWVGSISFEELWWRNTNVIFVGNPTSMLPGVPLKQVFAIDRHVITMLLTNYAPTVIPDLNSHASQPAAGALTANQRDAPPVFDLACAAVSSNDLLKARVAESQRAGFRVLAFSTNSAPLEFAAAHLPTGNHARTLLALVKFPARKATGAILLYGEREPQRGCVLSVHQDQRLFFTAADPDLPCNGDPRHGQWVCLAMVYHESGDAGLYLNGENVYQRLITLATAPSKLYIGARGFNGAVADVKIWDRPLAAAEIARISAEDLHALQRAH